MEDELGREGRHVAQHGGGVMMMVLVRGQEQTYTPEESRGYSAALSRRALLVALGGAASGLRG